MTGQSDTCILHRRPAVDRSPSGLPLCELCAAAFGRPREELWGLRERVTITGGLTLIDRLVPIPEPPVLTSFHIPIAYQVGLGNYVGALLLSEVGQRVDASIEVIEFAQREDDDE